MSDLSVKRQRFAEEYLIDLNARQAAIRAGYSARSAEVTGCRLLTDAKVQAAIAKGVEKRSERTQVTADQVLKELARLAFIDPRKVMTWGPDGVELKDSKSLTEDEAACVAEVNETKSEHGGSIRLKLANKIEALKLLGQHLRMFTEKMEHSGPDGAPMAHNFSNLPYDDLIKLHRETLGAPPADRK